MPRGTNRTQLSSRNQVTLPAALLREHGFAPGTEFLVEDLGELLLLIPQRDRPGPAKSYGQTAEDVAAYLAGERGSWRDDPLPA